MYVEKDSRKDNPPANTQNNSKTDKGGKPNRLTKETIEKRLSLHIDDPDRLFEGIFINN
jgi:hypothetical protein